MLFRSSIAKASKHRYLAKTLLVSAMTPGPKEPNEEELQEYQVIIVDDLIILFYEGVTMKTADYPNGMLLHPVVLKLCPCFFSGRLVRVALVAICSDHPAMCKCMGCADHNHNNAPCHKCLATKAGFFTDAGLSVNGMRKTLPYIHPLTPRFLHLSLRMQALNVEQAMTTAADARNTLPSPKTIIKLKKSSLKNMVFIGPTLPASNTLTSLAVRYLTPCTISFSVRSRHTQYLSKQT